MKRAYVKVRSGAPRVYSYLRFSTPEQKLGDSTRRQIEIAKKYAKEKGYVFDEELRDEGLSGWRGDNLKKGALGRFLDNVQRGYVPPGSILFVEELDRISREGMTEALETIVFGLIKHGITIATPTGNYDRESLNRGGIWRLIAKLETAHDESQKKSERLGRAWAEKKRLAREGGIVATSRLPHWLKLVNGKCEPIPRAVETIQLIFKLAPVLGRSRLVKKLNAEAPWKPPGRKRGAAGNGWRMSYVRKILSNRAVLGEYQPFTRRGGIKRRPDGEPIKNYFPAIIEPAVFHAVQRQIEKNKKLNHGGRTGAAFNLFQNIVKCAYCGGSMIFKDRGPLPKGGQYLICDNAQRGVKCRSRNVRYEEVQRTILKNCAQLKPEQVLADNSDKTKKCEALRMRISGAEGELTENRTRIANLIDQVSRASSPTIRDQYEKRIHELEKQNVELGAQLEFDRLKLQQTEKGRTSFSKWQRDFAALETAIEPPKAVEARLRLRSHLREMIAKVEVFADGYPTRDREKEFQFGERTVPAASDFAERVEAMIHDQGGVKRTPRDLVNAFLATVTTRRMTKAARFYRVHFLTGARMDVVPAGSLADGQGLVAEGRKRWVFISPELKSLWREFMRSRR